MNTNFNPKNIFFYGATILMMILPGIVYPQVKPGPVAPPYEKVQNIVEEAYEQFLSDSAGSPADYIPELARVEPDLFGISIITVDGQVFSIGDTDHIFSIQSISKVFTLAMVMEELGEMAVLDKLGAEPTGLPFNSVMAIELQKSRVGNPLVNAGAMATTSLLKGNTGMEKWITLLDFYSGCAGADLAVMQDVYESESATNERNRAMAYLLAAYGRIYAEPMETVDLYTRQCSVGITCEELATMGATLASGGVNPFTGKRVFSDEHVPQLLSVMLSCGMYDYSGTWSFLTGLPAKSGVGGGIVAVVPGKGAIAAFSPRLDEAGNSVRAQRAIAYISEQLDINIFAPQSVGVGSNQ